MEIYGILFNPVVPRATVKPELESIFNFIGVARTALLVPAVGQVLAVLMVLAADLAVGLFPRGLTPRAVILGRDMATGSVYYVLLPVVGALPYILWRSRGRDDSTERDESSGPGACLG